MEFELKGIKFKVEFILNKRKRGWSIKYKAPDTFLLETNKMMKDEEIYLEMSKHYRFIKRCMTTVEKNFHQSIHLFGIEYELQIIESDLRKMILMGNKAILYTDTTDKEINQKIVEMEDRIAEEFSEDFIQKTGIPRYQQELGRLKKASVVYKNFNGRLEQTVRERESAMQKLFRARSEYADKFRPCSFRIDAMDNEEYAAEQHLLEESELPKYRAKIKAAYESAMEQFQNDFLAKLKSSIDQVQDQVKSLNRALDQAQFGTDRYKFRVDRNPDYADYYDMIMAPELMEGEAGLFAMPFQQKYGKLIDDLFSRIAMSDDTQVNARKQSELQQNIE